MNPRAATLPDTSYGIGRMCVEMVDTGRMTAADLATYGIQFVWASVDTALVVPGVANGFYIPSRTDWVHHPELGGSYLGYPSYLAWMQAVHPEWISYGPQFDNLAGPVSVAYEYGELNLPLDIANTAVRDFEWSTYMQPALTKGYACVSLDSVSTTLAHWAPSTTVRNGHYQPDGTTYVTQYNPAINDPQYAADVLASIQDYASRTQAAGKALAGNLRLDNPSTRAGMQTILASLDVWLDEQTATNTGGARLNGTIWLTHQNDLAAKAKNDSIAVDSLYTHNLDSDITRDELLWALANYLTVKGQRSYFSLSANATVGMATNWQHPELTTVQAIGAPLEDCYQWNGAYMRQFTGGLAIVNPSLGALSVPLPAGVWRDLDARLVNSPLIILPTTAQVLFNGKGIVSPEYNTIGRLRVP